MLLTGQLRRSQVRLSLPMYSFSRDSSVSTAMGLMTGIRFLKWKNFSSHRSIQNFSACTYSRSNGQLVKRPGRESIIHLHLALKLRMCSAVPPLPPHVFMEHMCPLLCSSRLGKQKSIPRPRNRAE